MRRYTIHTLLLTIALLAVILLAMWFHRDGRARNVRWQPPEAQIQDFESMVPVLPAHAQVETNRFLAMLERPLFSPTRRPPPPAPPPAPPAPVEVREPLPNVHLYGLYGGESGGGAIVRVDGKNRRLHLNEAIDGWKLASIGERAVTFKRGSRSHSIDLVHVITKANGTIAAPVEPKSPAARSPAARPLNRAQQLRDQRARERAERARAASQNATPTPTSP